MDKNEKRTVKNPRENANIFSVLTFSWMINTFLVGYKKDLEEEDLYSPLKEDMSNVLGERIVKVWDDEMRRCKERKNNSGPSLLKVLIRCFGKLYTLVGIAQALMELIPKVCEPFIIANLIRCFRTSKPEWTNEIYYYSGALILCLLIDCFVVHLTVYGFVHIGMKIRVAISTLIYRKILRLSNAVLDGGASVGQVVNFLSVDVNRLDFGFVNTHFLWIGPAQTLLITYLVYQEFGWTGVLGIVLLLCIIPLQVYLGKQLSRLTLLSARRSDERLRLMNEVIGGVQIIKMYVWEVPFSYLVEKARRKEVNAIRKYAIVQQIMLTFDCYVPRMCIFVAIVGYVLIGNRIDAEKVFMITSFYFTLRSCMNFAFPLAIVQTFEAMVSINRLQKFMMSAEISTTPVQSDEKSALLNNPSTSICLRNVTAKWYEDNKENTLNGVSFSACPGELVAIVGQIGSGKSSLLHAILRELPLTDGSLSVHGKIGYVSQQAWIFASSVRQNILFGRPMDRARYNRVIEVCQLKEDIAGFVHGDSTVVGEKGISLSGGQRARINLARAVYADADVYLLDDPLSAVDTRVGRRIVDECICGFLSSKTIVLVTHQLQYLSSADQVIVMNNGNVETKGTYDEVRSSELIFSKLLESSQEIDERTKLVVRQESKHGEVSKLQESEKKDTVDEPVDVAETRSKGNVSFSVYLGYIKACKNNFLVLTMLFFFVLYQLTASGSDYFVAYWVNVEEASSVVTENGTVTLNWSGPLSRDWMIYSYSIMIVFVVLSCIFQTLAYFNVCMRSSRNLHAAMFNSVVRTSMYFFNVNPMGRILNRFSRDMVNVDMRLAECMYDVIVILLTVFAILVIVVSVNPWLSILIFFTTILFYGLRTVYIKTSRCVKRLEGVMRSPVFDHVGATLQGLTTIRAFKAEQILTKEFDNHQDNHSSAWFLYIASARLFGMYLDLICIVFIAITLATFLCFVEVKHISDVGLILTQLMLILNMLQWGIRQTAEMENQMTSVERVLEYSRLEEEPLLDSIPDKKPDEEWPRNGLVEFHDVSLRYTPNGAYVLKNVTFTIMPKEKIGVVGRTGAGKTSLISALFRLAYVDGDIRIDGISTHTIGLHDFRSKISIIPQEPVLFAGSLRRNLDPFEEYSDGELWQALQEVELKETIAEMAAGLHTRVSEGGINFSVGQRQLLCLARAIVRNNRIMVLDEATANVDPQTDYLIQKTVRKKFKDCTVFTVAHRLNTVMDSDKILVMDDGCMVEFDHPYTLLQNKGHLYNMVQQTGSAMAATLSDIAEKSFYETQNEAPSR